MTVFAQSIAEHRPHLRLVFHNQHSHLALTVLQEARLCAVPSRSNLRNISQKDERRFNNAAYRRNCAATANTVRGRKFMTIQRIALPLAAILFSLPTLAQSGRGVISGTVTDVSGAVLPGARIELAPKAAPAVSNAQGQFFVPNLAPGTYAVTVSYVGFKPYSTTVTIAAGQTTMVTAVMPVAAVNQQQVIV